MSFALRLLTWLAIAMLSLLLLLIPWSCYHAVTYREVGEHLPRVSWLPEEASDVSYFRTVHTVVYECRISEPAFLSLARRRGWELKPIREPTTVTGPAWFLSQAPRVEDFPGDKDRFDREFAAWLDRVQVIVRDGYTAGNREGDRGDIVVYDKETGRLNHNWSAR